MEKAKNKKIQVLDLQEIENPQSIEEASSFMEWVKQQKEREKLTYISREMWYTPPSLLHCFRKQTQAEESS